VGEGNGEKKRKRYNRRYLLVVQKTGQRSDDQK
jgi:hypothetical protein